MVVAAACFGATFFARDQPCASEKVVVVVVVAAAAAVVVVDDHFRAILNVKKTNCHFSGGDRQR